MADSPLLTRDEYALYLERERHPWRWSYLRASPPPNNSPLAWAECRFRDAFDIKSVPDDIKASFMALIFVDIEAAYQYAENYRTLFGHG